MSTPSFGQLVYTNETSVAVTIPWWQSANLLWIFFLIPVVVAVLYMYKRGDVLTPSVLLTLYGAVGMILPDMLIFGEREPWWVAKFAAVGLFAIGAVMIFFAYGYEPLRRLIEE